MQEYPEDYSCYISVIQTQWIYQQATLVFYAYVSICSKNWDISKPVLLICSIVEIFMGFFLLFFLFVV